MLPETGNTVYIIAGPTAVGKTDVALRLAQSLGTSIVSADSRQCYEGMAIGSAQPGPEVLAAVRHYFIGTFPVTTPLTAADFESLALDYLAEIFSKSDAAVVVGGTGLYLKALTEGLDPMPECDAQIVARVEADFKELGIGWLQEALRAEDPAFFAQAEIHNPARLIRGLSFFRTTGQSIIHFRSGIAKKRPFSIVKAGLELPRELLYARIDARVDEMMAAGLLAEVEALMPYRQLKNLHTVGYAELLDYLDGTYSLPEAVAKIKQHTRNYAKRQMTWFRKDQKINWLRADDEDIVRKITLLQPAGEHH